MGVITAPAIIYADSIHVAVLYEILKSLIKSGIAGNIIVSSNITIRPRQLKIISMVFQLELFNCTFLYVIPIHFSLHLCIKHLFLIKSISQR